MASSHDKLVGLLVGRVKAKAMKRATEPEGDEGGGGTDDGDGDEPAASGEKMGEKQAAAAEKLADVLGVRDVEGLRSAMVDFVKSCKY